MTIDNDSINRAIDHVSPSSRPLNVGQAVDLGSICDMAIYNKKVVRLIDGHLYHGIARHFVHSPENIGFPGPNDDIRDCYLRVISTTLGCEMFWKVSDLMNEFRAGYFCVNNDE